MRWLKPLRVAAAVAVLAVLTAAFVDFRGAMPTGPGRVLASAQFVPALLKGTAAGLAVIAALLVVTLVAGRVYCSVLCPLGLLQDAVIRIAGWLRRGRRLLPHARPWTKTRHAFLWGTVAAGFASGGAVVAWLDPYSIFGRTFSVAVRPAVTWANNAVVGLGEQAGVPLLYRVVPPWPAGVVLAVVVAMTAIVVGMAALRGRLYCNTVCPVGTLLGLVADRGLFRLKLRSSACTKCAECLRHCKAQCIDLRRSSIDFSRCVACFDCVSTCERGGIAYEFAWRGARPADAPVAAAAGPASPERRALLASAATGVATLPFVAAVARAAAETGGAGEIPALQRTGEAAGAVCPPGAGSVARFVDRCTACQLCVSACPTHVLRPALLEHGLEGMLKPRLDYATAYCLFECRKCIEVCPDGALAPLDLAAKQVAQIGVADLWLDRCVVKTNGTDCAACSEHCPTKAVTTVPYGDNLRLPQLTPDLCIGCGACEYACPVKPKKAIVVTARAVHAQARKVVEKPAERPTPADDFPF